MLQSALLTFIWGGKKPCCSWNVLTQPFERGGFEAPDMRLYYLCAQVQFAHFWYFPQRFQPHTAIEADSVLPVPLVAAALLGGGGGPVHCTAWAWKTLAKRVQLDYLHAPALPMGAHPAISATQEQAALNALRWGLLSWVIYISRAGSGCYQTYRKAMTRV